MIWCYGFVQRTMSVSPEEEYEELLLCEVYFDKNKKPSFYVPIDWEDIKEANIQVVLEDLEKQYETGNFFKDEDFNYEKNN